MATTKRKRPKSRRADANPTKAFFAQMLAKDISLRAAVFDLLDNSLDGARRLRGETKRLDGLWVRLKLSEDEFVITDNCGGIRISVAEQYAFRFGRNEDAQEALDFAHATGQFGVGMKRAIFKLGLGFAIESASDEGIFTMKEDVAKWVSTQDDGSWTFGLNVRSTAPVKERDRGTTITISPLHDTVADDFSMADFKSSLRRELAKRYVVPLDEGLDVKVNGRAVTGRAPKILTSMELAPTVKALRLSATGHDVEGEDEESIAVRLLCGVARIEAPDAGWSVGLNSRMVLLDDKTPIVGWDARNGTRVPAFHNQYGRLRGIALLDSVHTRDLPWNTTKTQLDVDHAVYRRVRREMMLAMEPVVRFLDRVSAEVREAKKADQDVESKPLHLLIDRAREAPAIKRVRSGRSHEFSPPSKRSDLAPPSSTMTSIQYPVDRQRVNVAKKRLQVRSNARVGEETFEFWWRSQFD